MNPRTTTGVLLLGVVLTAPSARAADALERGFLQPPNAAKPWVYWWFEGGYGNPEGMARDLAAMKEKGIGGVMHMQTINAGGLPLPSQPKMLGPEWDAWFGEAVRLAGEAGMTMSASILDGWSHGGWWVGKEDGAKQLVYAETQVDGPASPAAPLPQPLTRLGVYRDVAVVAFKENLARPPVPLEVTANNVLGGYCEEENWPAAHAVDGDPQTYWRTQRACSPESPAELDVRYAQPVRAVAAVVAGMPKAGPAEAEIQAAENGGKTFRPLARFTMLPGEKKRVAFAPVAAEHFRLAIFRAHAPDLQLAEFSLLRQGDEPALRPGIKWWDFKSANRAWWGWPPNPYEALEEEYAEDGARDVSAAGVVDLSSHLRAGGRLDWEFPAGRWTVLRFGWTPVGEPARMGTGGYEIDMLSTKGADLMMNAAAKRMRELSIKHAGGAPIVFHTDSWEIGAGIKGQQPTWTEDFREQFNERRGYDLVAYLPAMARRVVDDRRTTDRFLWDFRATVADLLAAYYGRLQERAHELGGTVNPESGYGSYPHPHMDGLQIFGRADRPMAEFWHPFGTYRDVYMTHVDIMRTAASGARIYGNRVVQAETLTFHPWLGQFTPPEQYRRTLHEAWARGLNQAVIHKYTHQPFEDEPGMLDYDIFNRHFAWWPLAEGFIGYMGRCQYLLQQGDFVADAAYFVGQGASRFVPGKEFLRPALPSGHDYDGMNAEVLLARLSVKDGQLALPDGLRYRYLVLCEPQCRTLSPAVLEKIKDLVKAGATLVGLPPEAAPGLTDRAAADAAVKAVAAELWGSSPDAGGDRKVGKGRVIWGRAMTDVLSADGVKPDVEVSTGNPDQNRAGLEGAGRVRHAVQPGWIHRRSQDADIYFLANPLNEAVDMTVTLRATGNMVRLFDPLDGSARDLPEKVVTADGRTAVPLHFAPNQAFFVVLRAGPASKATGRNFPALRPALTVEGPWRVSFDARRLRPLPPSVAPGTKEVPVVFERLVDWSKRPEAGIKGYSGVATYRKTFDLPAGDSLAGPCFLDVGLVKEMARVELNGRNLGVAWCPPWRLNIPEALLKPRGNELAVTVANTWNNRLCADGALPAKERLTRVGHGLQEQAAKGGLQPAGLLGPVRLMTAERVDLK